MTKGEAYRLLRTTLLNQVGYGRAHRLSKHRWCVGWRNTFAPMAMCSVCQALHETLPSKVK